VTLRPPVSHRSIWRRRPEDWRAAPTYLAMSYLYKALKLVLHLLIKHHLYMRFGCPWWS